MMRCHQQSLAGQINQKCWYKKGQMTSLVSIRVKWLKRIDRRATVALRSSGSHLTKAKSIWSRTKSIWERRYIYQRRRTSDAEIVQTCNIAYIAVLDTRKGKWILRTRLRWPTGAEAELLYMTSSRRQGSIPSDRSSYIWTADAQCRDRILRRVYPIAFWYRHAGPQGKGHHRWQRGRRPKLKLAMKTSPEGNGLKPKTPTGPNNKKPATGSS